GELFSLLETKPLSISFIIGPEGGFSSREFQLFTKLGFKGISLGNRILRSETAVIYLLSIIGFMLENKGEKHD
ncbi:MAG: RsmE family RNA methyltransferase, partial [Bacilli bacterium]|nr:RsmE family RNA methyltransferase [Bacilli bacterium]